ncbi:hypothetical protein A2U01_0068567, partial [Trifolium medium]|nr:hypothetical protein [Trifolium medium]
MKRIRRENPSVWSSELAEGSTELIRGGRRTNR